MVLYVLNSSLWLRKLLTCTARRELKRAVQLDPKSSAGYYKLAELYRKAGERERVQNALKTFQELKSKEQVDNGWEVIQGFLERTKTAGFRAG